MNTISLILKEIRHRAGNFLLSLLAMTAGVGLLVAFYTTGMATKKETMRNMRDMGYNLRIIPKETDLETFWDLGYSDKFLPEDAVHRFEKVRGLFYSHLTATLQQKIDWDGSSVLLTGIAAEVSPPDRKKPSMIFNIEPGTVYVGHELARSRGLKKGGQVAIRGQSFTVAHCLAERGSEEDIRLYAHLSDVQKLLNLEGRINEIQALDCYCQHPTKDTLTVLREQLAEVLPEAQVVKMQAMALARENQRRLMEESFAVILPVVVLVCGIWIGALAMLNTRQRREEIGVLRALGYGSWHIAGLFLGKSVVIGLTGALLGFGLGTALAMTVGPDLFQLTAKHLKPAYGLLGWALLLTPGFAMLASFIPSMLAVVQDPAETLRRE